MYGYDREKLRVSQNWELKVNLLGIAPPYTPPKNICPQFSPRYRYVLIRHYLQKLSFFSLVVSSAINIKIKETKPENAFYFSIILTNRTR